MTPGCDATWGAFTAAARRPTLHEVAPESTTAGDSVRASGEGTGAVGGPEVPWWQARGAYSGQGPSMPPGGAPEQGAGPYGAYPPYDPYGYGQGVPPSPYGPAQEAPPGPPGYRYAWPYVPPPPPRPPASAADRRRRRRGVLVLTGVLVVALGAGIGIGAAIAPTSPTAVARSLLTKTMAAAAAARSYHYLERTTILGSPDDIEGIALQNGGRQLIKQRCRSGTNLFALRLVHGVVYFRGNATAVIDQLGVPATRAGTVAGRWVKITRGVSLYTTFAKGITTRSNASQLPTVIVPRLTRPVSGSSPPTTAIVGALNAGKHKKPVGTAQLVVAASTSQPKLLRGSAVGTTGRFAVTWTWGGFGKAVSVTAPSGALTYGSLHVRPPAKNASGCV